MLFFGNVLGGDKVDGYSDCGNEVCKNGIHVVVFLGESKDSIHSRSKNHDCDMVCVFRINGRFRWMLEVGSKILVSISLL